MMTSEKFRSMSPRDFENGAVLDETYAALRDGERMRALIVELAEDYEMSGHPNCPLCGRCPDDPPPPHIPECDFGKFLAERAEALR